MDELRQGQRADERAVYPDDARFSYCGRVDFLNPRAPVMVFPATSVSFAVSGRSVRLVVRNKREYWKNKLGVIAGGRQYAFDLPDDGICQIDLSPCLDDDPCELTVFKRMDSCHALTFLGLLLGERTQLLTPPAKPKRRIEVYGDSVSAGEVAEAEAYAGKTDPPHNGEYSNVYESYAWIAARTLGASLHCIAQGGISLEDGCGYFHAPNTLGMMSCYDRYNPNPTFGETRLWAFDSDQPHVVIAAIGQNDAHPEDFMRDAMLGERANLWRAHYAQWIRALRSRYPKATIILCTTILMHSPQWDESIDMVARELQATDPHVYHFLYANNGRGTPGHVRKSEAEGMARELCAFIESLGPDIWRD